MSTSLTTVFPLALLVVFGLTGCSTSSTDETANAAVVETEIAAAEVVTETPAETEAAPQAVTNGSSEGVAAKPVNPMIERIQAMLKPDVIGPTLETSFAKFEEMIGGINDEATATEALPKLEGFFQQVNRMNAMSAIIPPESRPVIAEKVAAAKEPLTAAINKVNENEEVRAVLGTVFDKITGLFDALAKKFQPASDEETPAGDAEASTDGGETPSEETETPTEEAAAE